MANVNVNVAQESAQLPAATSNDNNSSKDEGSNQLKQTTPTSSNINIGGVTNVIAGDSGGIDGKSRKANVAAEKVLSVSANLAKLLPSGAVLVFQTLSANFTNQGSCNTANRWLSGLLVAFLTAACIFLTFTDSILHKGKIYYGVALPERLNVFGLTKKEERQLLKEIGPDLRERRLKTLDWVHAFFTAIVFISIAMGDVGLQQCFVPNLDSPDMVNVKELLRNAPLGLALLSSFVFMIFPTRRRGVGFDNGERGDVDTSSAEANKTAAPNQPQTKDALSNV
ncbi:DUF679 domain membrane protein 7 [Zea mays]|uniref:DUF679 domain membrane protein 7 n=1 Tax=Zea mays TaxID=4577 RepID=A0A1D6LXF0_MAIZE|nr:DUF679 domain membrane protein 7 [Zea mays]|eukprot:XP_008650531.1 protein DMP10 [Zea mays]